MLNYATISTFNYSYNYIIIHNIINWQKFNFGDWILKNQDNSYTNVCDTTAQFN